MDQAVVALSDWNGDVSNAAAASSFTGMLRMHHHHHHHHVSPRQDAGQDPVPGDHSGVTLDAPEIGSKRARLLPPQMVRRKVAQKFSHEHRDEDKVSSEEFDFQQRQQQEGQDGQEIPPRSQQQQLEQEPQQESQQPKLVLRDDPSSISSCLLHKAVRGLWKLTARNDCTVDLLQCCPDLPEIIVKELDSSSETVPIEASLLGMLVNITSTEFGRVRLLSRVRMAQTDSDPSAQTVPLIVAVLLHILHEFSGRPVSSARLAIAVTANLCHNAEFSAHFVCNGIFTALVKVANTSPGQEIVAQLADLVHVVLAFVPCNTLAPLRESLNDFLHILEPLAAASDAMCARRLALLELFHSRVFTTAVHSCPISRRMQVARHD